MPSKVKITKADIIDAAVNLVRRDGEQTLNARSIAMVLVSEPQILFLDEPTLGLDVLVRSELWDVIRSLKGKITIILTTHYMEEAEALSDRIGIMKSGRLLICDTVDKIKVIAGTDNFEQAFIHIVKEAESAERC